MYIVQTDYAIFKSLPANSVNYYPKDDSYYFFEEEKPTNAYAPLLIVPRDDVRYIQKIKGENE